MNDTPLSIKVTITITRKQSYDTVSVAQAEVSDMAAWDDVKPTAVHYALDSVLEDATDRVRDQLRAEHKRRLTAAREAAAAEEAC